MVDWARHRRLYGTLDPLSVLPFVQQYGDHLSPQARRLARVLDKATRGQSPLARHICLVLTELLHARHHGRHDDVELHRQHLVTLLARYSTRRRREGIICRRLQWPTPSSTLPRARLIGALTIAVAQRLGADTTMIEEDNSPRQLRMARVDDIVLLDHPADVSGPRSINCYRVDVQEFAAIDGVKFKLDPARLLYSVQWLHNGRPPDLHLQLVQEPGEWFDTVAAMLFGALNHHDPHLFDALHAD